MKIFAVSDVHGFTSILRRNLSEVGFEVNNPNHLLVFCGDLFDRGPEAKDMLKFIHEIDNKIMVKGNHEDLMQDMIIREYPLFHDIQNGTYDTALQLAWDSSLGDVNYTKLYGIFDNLCSQMVDFYETRRYVFVHGWIPVTVKDNLPNHYIRNRDFEFNPEWRTNGDWKSARWLSPVEMYKSGFVVPNKTIVCGHWHTSAAHSLLHNEGTEWGPDANFKPFYDEGIIMLDACTAYSGICNVVILED